MKRSKKHLLLKFCLGIFLIGISTGTAMAQEAGETPAPVEQVSSAEPSSPKSPLDNLKAEWEAVREQQIQMIREKEEQLEKLKEEIFAKVKALEASSVAQPSAIAPVASSPVLPAAEIGAPVLMNDAEFEKQKAALQVERQKFFSEMNRQKESLRQLQASLEEKTRQLEAERKQFELEKKKAVS